jgi:catechol 2,3-dioxygenase-like lactoylglutathione lyase family enzyme
MRLPSKPLPGGPHRRPSPHPRSGSHDRVRRPRPRPSTPRPATDSPDGLNLIGTATPPEAYAIPEAGSLLSAAVPEPVPSDSADAEDAATPAETAEAPPATTRPGTATDEEPAAEPLAAPAPEVEWWTDAAVEPAPPAVDWYPDRETEQPPTRVTRLGEGLRVAPYIDGDTREPSPDRDKGREPHEEPPPATASDPEETAAEARDEPDTRQSGSAWSANGHGPAPASLYNAPPIWQKASSPAPADDAEETAPDPYATEHYLPPEDQLEEQPLSEGAVAEFLATAPSRPPMPLDGVNGVSITLIVSDLQRSRRFYRDTLGLTELDSGPTSAVLETGNARVVLRRVADMPPVDRRVVHLNLDVPDVYEAYERLREQGVDFVHRPRVVPQGEQLELCSATFRDPDGHAIALTRWELRR